eukprot:g15150.t1
MTKVVKLYDLSFAPNPKRLRLYCIERDILKEFDLEDVLAKKGQKGLLSDEFVDKYPRGCVPAMELEDGTIIGDGAVCMRYLEKVYTETPSLYGRNPKEAAIVDLWESYAYEDGMLSVVESFRNSKNSPISHAMPGIPSITKVPALEKRGNARLQIFLDSFEKQIYAKTYICGEYFSAADITAFAAIEFASEVIPNFKIKGEHTKNWFQNMKKRPCVLKDAELLKLESKIEALV